MSNDRLSNLAILSIEKDLSKNISLEVVEEFSRIGSVSRRIVESLLDPLLQKVKTDIL